MTDQAASNNEFIVYISEECRFYDAELSQEATIRKLRMVRMEGELMENSVVRNFRTTDKTIK